MAEARDNDKDYSSDIPEDEVDPDDEKFRTETEQVFKNFVYRRLTSHIDKEATDGDLDVASFSSTLSHLRGAREEFEGTDDKPMDPSQEQINQLGQTLAAFGDEIQEKYHETFSDMICRLNISNDCDLSFSSFANIARKLFDHGINWGRIIALLCFGYEIAVTVIKSGVHGVSGFLRKIVSYVVKFIVSEKIAKWIAERGGWVSTIIILFLTHLKPIRFHLSYALKIPKGLF